MKIYELVAAVMVIQVPRYSHSSNDCLIGNNCHFQTDWCLWTSESTGINFGWSRISSATPTPSTGPKFDHTFGSSNGYYVYVQQSSPVQPHDTAELKSGNIPPFGSEGKCLSFWYHQWLNGGKDVSALRVFFKADSIKILLWEKVGSQENVWKRGLVQLPVFPNYPNDGRIIFEAKPDPHSRVDVAIDDILFLNGQCPSPYVPRNNDCDFEKPCLWTISSTGNFTWLLNRGYTQSFHTGPSFDLTLGSNRGHYVYTESSFGNINDKAWLISGNIVPIGSEGGCLSFWYHRYGEGIGPLRVKFKVGSERTLLWQRTRPEGNEWRRGLVQLPLSNSNATVVFEGVSDSDYRGDMALDDILFIKGDCPSPATSCLDCHVNATCANMSVSTNCSCSGNLTCTDIDQCENSNGNNCNALYGSCINTLESITCSCKPGFTGDGYNCTDINECMLPNRCNLACGATCVNTPGSFACVCPQGYTGDVFASTCVDINECGNNDKNCTNCTNTEGSFTCSCDTGFKRNGLYCDDINECETGSHNCSAVGGICTNTIGSFTCSCETGFTGNGWNCTDQDECLVGYHECHPNASCCNTVGSYECFCNAGYTGNGRSCTGQSVQNSCNMVSKSEILHINMFTSTVPVDRNECIGTCYTCSSLDACNASISQTNCRCCRPKVTENRTVKFRWFNPFSNLLYNFIIPVTKSCECSTCS